MSEPRLARVRAEYADRYPGLDPDAWYPAQSVADYFRAWLSRHPDVDARRARVLETAHFEFTGGAPREAPWTGDRDERRPAVS